MSAGGALSAGPGCAARSGPLNRTLCFSAYDAQADGHVRQVELSAEAVLLRRKVAGIAMALRVPLATYRGVALRACDHPDARFMIVLEHRDPGLSVPLEIASEAAAARAAVDHWSFSLGIGEAAANEARPASVPPRRRRTSAVRGRRPVFLYRRKAGKALAGASVHRDEREIIARA